jgi:hypothetical protein
MRLDVVGPRSLLSVAIGKKDCVAGCPFVDVMMSALCRFWMPAFLYNE